MIVQPIVCGCILCIWPTLHTVASSRGLPVAYFMVLHPLPAAWSAETRLPMDSQVVTLIVWACHFPTSLGCRHPSCSFESDSVLQSVLPWALGSIRNHASRVTACPSSVGEPAKSGPLNGFPVRLVWVTSNFILLIYSSSLALSFHSLVPDPSNSWSFILSHRKASHNCRIPSRRSSCSSRTGRVMFHLAVDSVPLASPHYARCRWMTALLQCGCRTHPPIHT